VYNTEVGRNVIVIYKMSSLLVCMSLCYSEKFMKNEVQDEYESKILQNFYMFSILNECITF
jgi:hypothetical protein